MPMEFSLSIKGKSGRDYSFSVFPLEESFQDVGAVYVFLHVPSPAFVEANILYVGIASALERRLHEHRREGGQWVSARQLGFNRIGAIGVPSEENRIQIERDLIQRHLPPLNAQNNPLAQAMGTYLKERNEQ